ELMLPTVPLRGAGPPADIARYYDDADIYLQTPSIDNMPLSVLEAFASGLPVVSTRVGGVSSMLSDGVHGLLAPDGDDAAVAAQVMRLLDDPARARRLAAAAHESCATYAWPVVREGWLAAYRAAVGRRGPGACAAPAPPGSARIAHPLWHTHPTPPA